MEKVVHERNRKERESAILSDTTLNHREQFALIRDNAYQPKNVPVRVLEATAKSDSLLIPADFHPFMAAMHTAYAEHYPMTISPDMIWLLIVQGFANHINQNPDKMRGYFVNFKGKKNLNIDRPEFEKGSENNDWPGTFAEFSKKIQENTGAELLDLVTGNFSTTSPIEKAAFQITLMDAMKSYFTYSVTSLCGIPEITLEGTVRDWEKVEAKTRELAQYDLEWWTSELMPILREFTTAAAGKPDSDFWQSMYKWEHKGSGDAYITGWILKFFPYKDYDGKMVQFVGAQRPYPGKKDIGYDLSATTKEFTSGLSRADFIWNYYGTFYKMEFVAGFVGFQQDTKTLALRPEISWAVIDKQMRATAEEIEDYRKGGNKEYRESLKKQ